jgi:hypothetical protein
VLAWVHYAPALKDGIRKTYRRLLRWNDELPFVKFALSEDERVMLTAEVPGEALDRDAIGRTLARLVAVCDLLADESADFLGQPTPLRPPQARPTDPPPSDLLDRYAADIAELTASPGGPPAEASEVAPPTAAVPS